MLELRNLSKTFVRPTGAPMCVAKNLDLIVPTAQTVAILGASGSGKSTLLKIIAGLEHMDAGSVHFEAIDLHRTPPERRGFALLFQDFALFPHLNVQDNVAFGLIEQGISKPEARTRAAALLGQFGLGGQVFGRCASLSGGEQQRVVLARALITQPRLLLLDEPFSALDADLKRSVRDEFMRRIAASRITTILVTHDETEARAMAQTAYRLESGRLNAIGRLVAVRSAHPTLHLTSYPCK